MRYDKRYTRVPEMLADPAIPRRKDGGLLMCRGCQRMMMFAGGFWPILIEHLRRCAIWRIHNPLPK